MKMSKNILGIANHFINKIDTAFVLVDRLPKDSDLLDFLGVTEFPTI
jgi:hypothetical protein